MIGIVISSIFVFGVTDMMFNLLYFERSELRANYGYEAVFYDATKEQAEQMVKNYNVADYCIQDYEEPVWDVTGENPYVHHDDCVFVTFEHPYFMRWDYRKICDELGVTGELNEALSDSYHLFGSDDAMMAIFVSFGLLLVYLVSIPAIMVTKNTLKLSVLEKIEEYGVLRCIGTSLKQLKRIVLLEAVLMAIPASIIGSLLGYVLTVMFVQETKLVNMDIVFSPTALLVTVCAILLAMYFSSTDPCRMLGKITPVMAMREQLKRLDEKQRSPKQQARIDKRQAKKQLRSQRKMQRLWERGSMHKGIAGHLFGIEGMYASINMKRSQGKYTATMIAFGVSIAIFVGGMTGREAYKEMIEDSVNAIGAYNLIYEERPEYTYDTTAADYGEVDAAQMELLSQQTGCLKMSTYRRACGYLAGDIDVDAVFNEDYTTSVMENQFQNYLETKENPTQDTSTEKTYAASLSTISKFDIYTYDEEDMNTFQEENVVEEGTTNPEELGENGVILMNYDDFYNPTTDKMKSGQYTNYKVGDTISLLDLLALREEFEKQYQTACEEQQVSASETYGDNSSEYQAQQTAQKIAFARARQIVEDENLTTEVVIKGIITRNCFNGSEYAPQLICNEDTFYAITGMPQDLIQGYQFAIDTDDTKHANLIETNRLQEEFELDENGDEQSAGFIVNDNVNYIIMSKESMTQVEYVLSAILFLLFSISVINIVNLTASSIYLRKAELAEMRVLGMSKRRVGKMLSLEGIFMAGISAFWGIAAGLGVGWGITAMVRYMNVRVTIFHFPVVEIVIVCIITVTLMIISTVISMLGFDKNLAKDLVLEE
jgi:putative ABC transport system permease protein